MGQITVPGIFSSSGSDEGYGKVVDCVTHRTYGWKKENKTWVEITTGKETHIRRKHYLEELLYKLCFEQ